MEIVDEITINKEGFKKGHGYLGGYNPNPTRNLGKFAEIKVIEVDIETQKKRDYYIKYLLNIISKGIYDEEFIKGLINKINVKEPENCWEWMAATTVDGYGYHSSAVSRNLPPSVHRLIYTLINGKIPEGKEIHHKCHNRTCVNVNHMELITHQENVKVDHSSTICFLCKNNETYISPKGYANWFKYTIDENDSFDRKGKWDEKSWLCIKCYNKVNPDSTNNKLKTSRKFRNKQLSRNSETGKGFIGQQIWCKARGVKDCNIELDNFRSKHDHSPDIEYGIVDTKIATERHRDGQSNTWKVELTGYCNHIVCFCMDAEWKNVERTYIIPKNDIGIRKSVFFSRNSSPNSWYEKYRVDETPYNEAYHQLDLKNCPILIDEPIKLLNPGKPVLAGPKLDRPKEFVPFKKKVFKITK